MKKFIKIIPLIFVYITIVYLSVKTPTGKPSPFENIDKLYHFIAYGSLGFAVCLSTFNKKIVTILLFISFMLGMVLEFIQGQLPYRDMSVADGIANTLGLLTGVLVFFIFFKLLEVRSTK